MGLRGRVKAHHSPPVGLSCGHRGASNRSEIAGGNTGLLLVDSDLGLVDVVEDRRQVEMVDRVCDRVVGP